MEDYEKKLNNIIIQYSNKDGLYKDHYFFNLSEKQIKEFEQFIMKFKSKFHQSEDEKNRKRIISVCQHYMNYFILTPHDKDNLKEALAWLEKQGESKFEQCIQEGDKIVTNEDGTHFNTSQLERVAKKEQESAWSEEDNSYYDDVCEILINLLHSEKANINKDVIQKDLGWLKSLKDRVQPQWKPSEEELNALDIAKDRNDKTGWYLCELYKQLKKL